MATAEEIIVKLTAQTEELKAGMAEAATTVQTAQDAMAASVRSSMDTFAAFDAIQKGSIKTAQDAAAAQKVLNDARASMAYTDEELAAKEAIASAAMAKIPRESEAAQVATNAFSDALTRNSRTAYTTSALISDALSGQFSRSKRELAAMANETGVMSSALSFLLSPAGFAAAAIAAIGVAAIKAHEDMRSLEGDLALAGDGALITASDIDDMAARIEASGASSGRAKDALDAVIKSGKFTADEFVNVGDAAAAMADMTGGKVDQMVTALEKLQENPVAAIRKLNATMYHLTPTQVEEVARLDEMQGHAVAAAKAFEFLAITMSQEDSNFNKTGNWFDKWTAKEGEFFSQLFHGGGELPIQTQLNQVVDTLNKLKEDSGAVYEKAANGEIKLANAGRAPLGERLEMNRLLTDYNELLANAAAQHQHIASATAQEVTSQQQTNAVLDNMKGSYAALAKQGFGGIDLKGNLSSQLADLEAAQKVSYDKREEYEMEYWGTILQRAQVGGSQYTKEYVQAWNEVQTLQRRVDSQQLQESEEAARKQSEASRKAAEDAKREHEKDAQAALNALNIKRDATQKYAQERLAIDAEIVRAAIQWYGKDSSAYREALRQKENDAREDAQHEIQVETQAATAKHEAALQDIQDSNQAAQEKFRNGEITAQQLLEIELKNNTQKILSDVQYYNERETLAGKDVKAIETLEAKLTDAIKKANAERVKDAAAAQRQIAQSYEKDMQPVTNAIQQSVNGMIQGTQTAKQAIANIGQSILSEFIANEAKQLEAHIANELAKTSVTETSNAARVAADTAGQAQSLAVQGASAIKWITTEAAKAAAGAFNALVSIPYVGPFLAVGASIAAGAAVLALIGRVASAEGGWERVPGDGVMTQLHKDEMVLPKRVADPIRNMARGGGNGGALHVHVHANDARSFRDYLKRNPGAMQAALAHAGRNGW